MTTLYGVRQETLEAYLKAERKKILEEVADFADEVGDYQTMDYCRIKAAKEQP